jgi:hypothetical protein
MAVVKPADVEQSATTTGDSAVVMPAAQPEIRALSASTPALLKDSGMSLSI